MAVGSFQSAELKTLLVPRQQVAPGHSPVATVLLREVHDQHLYLHNNIVILPLNLKTLPYEQQFILILIKIRSHSEFLITRLRHADYADLTWIIETFEDLKNNKYCSFFAAFHLQSSSTFIYVMDNRCCHQTAI